MQSIRSLILGGLAVALLAVPLWGQSAAPASSSSQDPSWLRRLEALEETLRRLEEAAGIAREAAPSDPAGPVSPETRLALLEARVAALLEKSPAPRTPMQTTAPTATTARVVSQLPVAGALQDEPEHIPVAGYMEMHYNKPADEPGQLDFHRFVLLFGHSFSSRLRFWSELELEHAFVEGREEKGELELEQAYLDFLLSPAFNLRGGMLLAPMGMINERHEPPSFFGVERPQVDTVIIPSTWFDAGFGAWGDLGSGFSYRAYLMAPLDASGFTAAEGLRGGRQKGFQSHFQDVAGTFRIEYRGLPRLVLGTSYWGGRTGFDLLTLKVPVHLFNVDGRYRFRNFQARGQYSHNWVGEARDLNRALIRRRGSNPNIAEQMRGFYLEGAVHLLPSRIRRDLAAFVRYENFDTQFRMPDGFLPRRQFDRSSWTLGMSFYPHPDIVLKMDYVVNRNRSEVFKPRNQFNLGLGWWF